MKANILILDDDEQIQRILSRLLQKHGYGCATAFDADEARNLMKKQNFELLLCDINLPGESGLDFIAFVFSKYPNTAGVIISGTDNPISAEKSLEIGVFDYIAKPFDTSRVLFSVANALKRRELRMANNAFHGNLEKLVAERTQKLKRMNLKLRQKSIQNVQARKVLKESERKYRVLINNIPGFVYKGYKDWSVDFTDNKVGELTGYDKTEFDARRLKWSDIISKEDIEAAKQIVVEALKTNNTYIREYQIKTKNKQALWIQDRGHVILDQKGEIKYFSGIFFDINKQKHAEEQLRKNERYYRSILTNMHESIAVINRDYQITDINKAYLTGIGRSRKEIIGQFCYKVNHGYNEPCDQHGEVCRLREVFETGKSQQCSHEHLAEDGSTIYVDISMAPLRDDQNNITHVIEAARNVTAQKQAEEDKKKIEAQLVQSEKMASVGQLAAGVAHEINNPTGFVSSNLKTLSEYIKDINNLVREYRKLSDHVKDMDAEYKSMPACTDQMKRIATLEDEVDIDFIIDDISELIEESREGTERIKNIVEDLKDFAHPGEDKPKYANINKNLDSTVNVVRNELKYKADVIKEYGELPEVRCYPQMLNQVFMNLLVNAAQAINERGEIRIQTRTDNGYVEIKISDTGSGIPEENLSKIFDPFFTTKEIGKGTGLGLNLAYNIIQKHRGKIDVESTVGSGTTFTIKLPVKDGLTDNVIISDGE